MGLLRELAVLCLIPAAAARADALDPVVVSATRSGEPRSQVPFTVEVLGADAFADGFALTADDALRGSSDFSLFRRNDSMTANPTSQGVSLRGLGPSGASRSLVLLDGVPLNDPFGGWVPWSLVPVDSVAGAEIVPGGGASAWGNNALAGVIQIFTAQPKPGEGYAAVRGGTFATRSADLSEAVGVGRGTLEVQGEAFATQGTVLIAPQGRGPVDIAAASRHTTGSARWHGTLAPGIRAVVTLRNFTEWRDNGTAYQQNRSHQLFGSASLAGSAGAGEAWNATAYVQDQGFSQSFSSVNASRTAETPASDQFAVPTTALGFAASSTWTDPSGAATTAGADLRTIRGETRERFAYSKGAFTEQRAAGGAQAFAGLFVERIQPLGGRVRATAGLRVDRWSNTEGHRTETSLATGQVLTGGVFSDRSGLELSPSAGLSWDATDAIVLHVAGQRAFREPTLNELYRPFRQGSTITEANPALSTEHATSGEVGATWSRGRLRMTLAAFAALLEDAVSNVTVASGPGTFPLFGKLPPGGIGQQRMNLDRVGTHGLQLGASWSPCDALSLDLSVMDERASVTAASAAPGLVGRRLPEVPRWNASLGMRWHAARRVLLSASLRSAGSEFDDDQNQLPLASATVADAAVKFQLTGHAELFATVENLGDAQVETAHSAAGVFSVAPGRSADAGARFDW